MWLYFFFSILVVICLVRRTRRDLRAHAATRAAAPAQHAFDSAPTPIPASASVLAGPTLVIDRVCAVARTIVSAGTLDCSCAIASDRACASEPSIDYVSTPDGVPC